MNKRLVFLSLTLTVLGCFRRERVYSSFGGLAVRRIAITESNLNRLEDFDSYSLMNSLFYDFSSDLKAAEEQFGHRHQLFLRSEDQVREEVLTYLIVRHQPENLKVFGDLILYNRWNDNFEGHEPKYIFSYAFQLLMRLNKPEATRLLIEFAHFLLEKDELVMTQAFSNLLLGYKCPKDIRFGSKDYQMFKCVLLNIDKRHHFYRQRFKEAYPQADVPMSPEDSLYQRIRIQPVSYFEGKVALRRKAEEGELKLKYYVAFCNVLPPLLRGKQITLMSKTDMSKENHPISSRDALCIQAKKHEWESSQEFPELLIWTEHGIRAISVLH
jgi:hypothetical protein